MVSNAESGRDTGISLAVLGLLAIIAFGVYRAQYQINPAVTETGASLMEGSDSPAGGSRLTSLAGPALEPISPLETYTPENLYEKIDGKADLYHKAGFAGLTAQRFALKNEGALWLEAMLYDMGSPDGAFAVFSQQRRSRSVPLNGAVPAYVAGNIIVADIGPYYLELIGSREDPALLEAMREFARNAARLDTAGETKTPRDSDLFPPENRVEGSVALQPDSAFGIEGLDNVYTAQYLVEDESLFAFVARRESPEEALALADAFQETLMQFGAVKIDLPGSPSGMTGLEFMGVYEIVFTRGSVAAGIHEAARPETAIDLALRLAEAIEKAGP